MDGLSLDSDGGEVDRDECDESTLASTFPSTYQEVASVGVAMEKVYVLDLARVGDQACAGLDSGKISLHSLETLARSSSLTGHSKPVTGVVGSPAGSSTLYSCSQDQTVRVWDLRKPGGTVAVLRDTSGGTGLDKSRKGPPGKNEGRSLQCLSLSSDDHTVVAGTEQVGVDSFLLFWDTRQPGKLQGGYWESHNDDVTSLQFHPNHSNTLASGSTDGQVNIFDISQPDEDAALVSSHQTEDSVARLCWYSRKGQDQQLAIGTHTEEVQLWSIEAEGPHTVLSRAQLCHGIRRSAAEHCYMAGFHQREGGEEEGLVVVAGSSYAPDPCLRLALVKNKKAKPLALLKRKSGNAIVRCSLHIKGSTSLLTGGEDGVIRLWGEGDKGLVSDPGKVVNKSKVRDKPY